MVGWDFTLLALSTYLHGESHEGRAPWQGTLSPPSFLAT